MSVKLSIDVTNDTVIEASEKLKMVVKLLRKLVYDGVADEDGDVNVSIKKRLENPGLMFNYVSETLLYDQPIIVSMLKTDYKNGRSETTVKFLESFANFAKSNKTFAEFCREKEEMINEEYDRICNEHKLKENKNDRDT